MSQSLEELGVNTEGALIPVTNVICIMKSGAKVGVYTPLSPKDVMTLWNTKKRTMKIPTGENSYAVIKKQCVDFLHAFLTPKLEPKP